MDSNSQAKQWIQEAYGKVARGRGSCCGPKCCSPEADAKADGALSCCTRGEQIGYSPEELASVPEGANLGLGCGNPIALAGLQPGETVVDLGSGAGFDCFLAAQRVGPTGKVIGIDMTPEMVQKARANARQGSFANVDFREGDIEALPLEDASADIVISNCVLNLVPDKAQAFREIYRVLRPGGRLAVSDIVLTRELPEELRKHPEVYSSCLGGAIGKEEYLQLLQAAGFPNVEVVDAVDAGELLLGALGPVSDWLRQQGISSPHGWAESVKIQATKPQGDGVSASLVSPHRE